MLEIKIRTKDNIVILDLVGKIDVNAANFIEVVGQCLREGWCNLLCNFEEVEVVDYMGISVLVIAYKEVVNNNGRMKFTNIPAHLKNIFSISGLDAVIDLYATEEVALNSFQEDKIIEKIKKLQLRRRFKRLPIDIKIELKDKYETCCLKGDILNLSAVGAYIFGCSQFKLGDELIIKFKLLPTQEEIKLQAKVVWLSDKQFQPHLHPGMGVEFCNLSSSVQEKLIEFIERNLSFMSFDE